jgi:PAS domain S-box-containing protein
VNEWSADLQNTNDALLAEIGERQRAEEALRASERRLQDILDNHTAVVSVKDLELRYILVNREYEHRHQVQRNQILEKTDFDIHPRDVAEAIRANDRQVIQSGVPIQFEEAVPSAGGERWVISARFPLRDHTGKSYAICGIATDITERKRHWSGEEIDFVSTLGATVSLALGESNRARSELLLRESEARLRESEERFSTAFRLSPLNITILRLSDARFVEANDAFVRWLGLDRDKIIGHDSRELNIWPNLGDRANFLADLRRSGSLRDVECRLRSWRGTIHTLLQSAEIIEINREPHMLVVGLDITERKNAEDELLRTVAKEKELGSVTQRIHIGRLARVQDAAGHHPLVSGNTGGLSRPIGTGRTQGPSAIDPEKHPSHGRLDGGSPAPGKL